MSGLLGAGPRAGEVALVHGETWVGDVQAIVRRLVSCLREREVPCWEGAKVDRLTREGDRIAIEIVDGSRVAARRVVLATGPWLGRDLGFAVQGTRVKRVVAYHVERTPERNAPIVFFEQDGSFLLPLPDRGQWVVSFTSQRWEPPRPYFALDLGPVERTAARELLATRAPALASDLGGGRVFCDAYTADRTPRVEWLWAPKTCLYAGAGSGSGFRLAPGIAERAVGELLASGL